MPKYLKFILKVILCLISSAYLTALVSARTLTTDLQVAFAFCYFMVLALVALACYRKYLCDKSAQRTGLKLLLSLTLALLCFFSCGDMLVPEAARATSVTVTATGAQNESAQGSEVRITAVRTNGSEIDLSKISLADGWQVDEYGGLLCIPSEGPKSLEINFEKASQIEISFLAHPWSGMVRVQDGAEDTVLDLFSPEATDRIYEVQSNTSKQSDWVNVAAIIFLTILFFSLMRLSEAFSRKWLIPIGAICTLLAAAALSACLPQHYEQAFMTLALPVAAVVGISLILSSSVTKGWRWYCWTVFVLVDMIITFQFTAQFLFMELWQTTVTLQQLTLFVLSCAVFAPLLLLICHIIDWLDQRNQRPKTRNLSKRTGRTWLIALPLTTFIITIILAYQIFPQFVAVSYRPTEITLVLTNDRNDASQGNEALLSSNVLIDGASVPLVPRETVGDWPEEGGYLWGKTPGSKIVLSFPRAEDIDLHFNKHAWSGIVEITDGESITRLDLYSDSVKDYIANYHVQSNIVTELSPVANILLSLLAALITGGVVLLLVYTTLRKTSPQLYTVALFLMMTCIWAAYLCAGNPGAISIDTISQFSQAKGVMPISDAHPALLTMWYRLLFHLTDSPILISLFQISAFALVTAVFLQYLSLHGLSRKITSIFAVLFSAHLVNGIYASTLWKDVLFTVCLLWMTYLMVKLAVEKRQFFSWRNIVQMGVCMALTVLIRHNGIIVFILAGILLVVATITNRSFRPAVAFIIGISIFAGVKGPVYSAFEVANNQMYSPSGFLHGMEYISLVTGKTNPLLKELAPQEDWAIMYEPYSTNSFAYSEAAQKNQMSEKMQILSPSVVNRAYIRAFAEHPFLIIKDRLFGCNLLWNSVPSGYNWRVGNDQYIFVVENNNFGFYCRENILTDLVSAAYQASISSPLDDMLIWRAGPYLAGVLLLLFLGLTRRKYGLLLAGMPLLGNGISLVLAMAWQDFRYVYFVFVCGVFLLLASFVIPSTETIRKE